MATVDAHFYQYLKHIANMAEARTLREIGGDVYKRILVHSGVQLNWLGDYLANPEITWEKRTVAVSQVLFTGTNPEWNDVLIDRCKRSVNAFVELCEEHPRIRDRFAKEASFSQEPILLRRDEARADHYKVLDGMHRFLGHVLDGDENIEVYIPVKEDILPLCEAHTVYDLIRGFQRHAYDEQGAQDLEASLRMLLRCYSNARELLEHRFTKEWIHDEWVTAIIKKVL